MQTRNTNSQIRPGQFLSYTCGIIVAAVVVGILILTFYLTSSAFAAQMLKTKSVAQLAEIIGELETGQRPNRGPMQDRVLGAILLLGEGKNELSERINSIAIAGNISDTEYETAAQIAIKKLGPATHDRLKAMLASEDPKAFFNAVICIRLLGADAQMFVPQLIEMLESGDARIVRYGVFALQDMGPSATPAVEALDSVISALDFNAQIMACKTVVGIGRAAAPMVANLVEIYEKGIPSARSWAGIALGAIGPVAGFDTAQLLGSRITAFNHVEKTRALQGLALMGDEAESQQQIIETAMLDPKGRVRPQAAYAYYRVTGETQRPVQTLVEMLTKRDYRGEALTHLGKMGTDAQSAIPQLIELLKHENVAIRESAVLTLGNMGAAAAHEILAIQQLASDPDPLLRQAVQEAVDAIQKDLASKK